MTHIWAGVKSERNAAALARLQSEARRDLERLNFPASNWVPARLDLQGRPMLDALIVGAGLCGQTVGFALMRDGIRNFRIIDRAARGREGPWATYARMEILRSPKHLTGADLGVPSLTFRAWYEAQHGADGWQRLHKAGRLDWRDYLLWVRDTVAIPVENDVELMRLAPTSAGVVAEIRSGMNTETVTARHVVLACGRDGAGGARLPDLPGLRQGTGGRVAHASQPIDFAGTAGLRVAVLGAGASAFDCAASALEAGAAQVVQFVRRPHLPQVNKSKWTSFPGFMKGFVGLDDATRFKFYSYIFAEQVPPPWESVARCDAHANFELRFSEPWLDVAASANEVAILTPKGRHVFDVAILATGFDVDLAMRGELADVRHNILLWSDRIGPEAAAQNPECARFPYLGPGFELLERQPGETPGLQRIHVFNWGVTLSHGALAGDIPGLRTGVDRLSEALCRSLLSADIETHWQALRALEDPELEPTGRYVPPAARTAP
jgi:cation diffusion facilitator CzcD-associated flavoprotein CzcO